jgi:hypothetical protein
MSWRVQAWASGSAAAPPTHQSLFGEDEARARRYYDALDLPFKRLQLRRPGEREYKTQDFAPNPVRP